MEKITQYLIQSTVQGSEVRAWEEDIMLPTYEIGKEEKNPIFLEKRVYQGSCGSVYPYPVVEKISDKKADKRYHALFIENEYIKVMILPELGGRIHMAYDKVKKRHFVYYNQVVKPALVGLTGPWISGGIEFNWPQHHRPSTFLPTDFLIEENADGSKTIWCNEVERMFRTKGMQGFTLYPGKAYIEIKVKIYNRTSFPQTFLWWANPAVVVNDHYHSVFPPDVNAVFDHGKRDVSSFPIATGVYYKQDYSAGVDISNYAGKYLLTATARYDGSSKFAKGNQWGIFPSVSAAWNITEEKFMKNQTIFDQLKLRAGFGIVGNQNIDDFAYLSLYNVSYTGTSDTGYTNSFVSNGRRGTPDISWEKQKQWNLGVDMAFLQNRVRLSVDAFLIKNKDLLMSHSLPTTTGFSSTIENIGAIENKGLEFALNANLVRAKDFEWNFAATLSMDKNKVTRLYGDNDVVYNVDSDRNIQKEGNLFLGESRNTIYIWKTGGIAQEIDMDRLNKINWNGYNVNPGDLYPLDYDNNGQIDQNDRVVIGSTDPKFYGGFSTDFSWKGLSLNAVFSYSYGAKKLSPWYETLIGSTGSGVASTDLLDRWTPENTDAEFPRVLAGFDYNHYGASSMDFSVQKASFLRLSALTLAYTFPTKVINALKLANLRVYATGSNLFCLTNYNGYDPETGDWYPPTRMYTFGLNLAF